MRLEKTISFDNTNLIDDLNASICQRHDPPRNYDKIMPEECYENDRKSMSVLT